MKYFILAVSVFLLTTQKVIGQVQSEGIDYDPSKKYYVITYCCAEDSSFHQGVYIPGHLVDPAIKALVDLNTPANLYTYSYKIENKATASRLLYSFSVALNAEITNLNNPNDMWVSKEIEWKSIIKWYHSRGKIKGIKPSSKEIGFSFQSSGLPSIVDSYASSNTFTGFPDEGPSSPELQIELDSLEATTQHVKLKTIGPRKLPENISNTALLDTLHSYLAFSCDTTWIESLGTCRSLQAKLENVERQLERGNNRPAAGSLQALLNQLDALREKQLSSEAYALLYYNGQYLLGRLSN